eukprot:scpid58141/ scgid9648/ 
MHKHRTRHQIQMWQCTQLPRYIQAKAENYYSHGLRRCSTGDYMYTPPYTNTQTHTHTPTHPQTHTPPPPYTYVMYIQYTSTYFKYIHTPTHTHTHTGTSA